MKKLILALFVLLCWVMAGSAWGATYYVSPSGDNSDGLTPATAYNLPSTLIATNKPTPPHMVYVAPGTYYDEYLALSNAAWAGISMHGTSAHGSTSPAASGQVVISGSADTTAWTWTDEGAGVFSMNSPANVSVLPNSIWYGTTRLTGDGVGAPPTPASGHWGYTGTGPYALYINVDGGSSPPTDGTLRVPQNNYVVLTGQDDQTFNYISFESANTTVGGVIYVNQNAGTILSTCTVGYSNLYFIYADLSTANDSLTISNCSLIGGANNTAASASGVRVRGGGSSSSFAMSSTIINAPTVFGLSTATAGPASAMVEGCTIAGMQVNNSSSAGIAINHGTGWVIDDNTIYNIGESNGSDVYGVKITTNLNQISDNTIYGVRRYGMGLASADSNTVEGNIIYHCGLMQVTANYPYTYPSDFALYGGTPSADGGAIIISGSSEANTLKRNTFHHNTQSINLSTTSGAGGNVINSNLSYFTIVNGIGAYTDGNPVNRNEIINNTAYHSPAAGNNPTYTGHGFHVQDDGGGGGKLTIANNVCYSAIASSNAHAFFVSDNTGLDSLWLNNNDWHAVSGGINANVLGTDYTNSETYISAAHSAIKLLGLNGVSESAEDGTVFVDPLFVNASAEDFQLATNSLCLKQGSLAKLVDLTGFQIDIDNNEYYFTPYDRTNIGASQVGSDADTRPLKFGLHISQ